MLQTDEQVPDESTHVDYGDHHFAFPETPNSLDSKVPYETFEVEEFTPDPLLAPITTSPFATSLTSMKNNMAVARDFVVKITDTGPLLTLCNTLHCNFSTSPCNHYVRGSEWRLSHGPVGKSSRGIGGDASQLPYNPGLYSTSFSVEFNYRAKNMPKSVKCKSYLITVQLNYLVETFFKMSL